LKDNKSEKMKNCAYCGDYHEENVFIVQKHVPSGLIDSENLLKTRKKKRYHTPKTMV
jgi:hypothetical protein